MADSYGIGDGLKTTFGNQLIVGTYNEFPWDEGAIIVGNGTTSAESTSLILTRAGDVQMADDDDIREAVSALGWDEDVLTNPEVE